MHALETDTHTHYTCQSVDPENPETKSILCPYIAGCVMFGIAFLGIVIAVPIVATR